MMKKLKTRRVDLMKKKMKVTWMPLMMQIKVRKKERRKETTMRNQEMVMLMGIQIQMLIVKKRKKIKR